MPRICRGLACSWIDAPRGLKPKRRPEDQAGLRIRHNFSTPPSRPGESHPEPLTDPDVRLSPHPARATQRRLAPSGETAEFLRSPVDPTNTVSDPPPSLHGHYPASSLLWGGPRLTGPSVLSASRVHRLCLFPWHGQPGSQVPYESPDESHYDCLWQAEARSKRGVSSCGVYLPDLDQPRPPDL